MKAFRFYPFSSTLTEITIAGAALILVLVAPVAATPWRKSRGEYDSRQQRRDVGWPPQNLLHEVTGQDPDRLQNQETRGRVDDDNRVQVWHYGDGGFDRKSTGLAIDELTEESPKASTNAVETHCVNQE